MQTNGSYKLVVKGRREHKLQAITGGYLGLAWRTYTYQMRQLLCDRDYDTSTASRKHRVFTNSLLVENEDCIKSITAEIYTRKLI